MPFKSEAQRRLFFAKARRGEIPMETVRHWQEETGDRRLPEKVKKEAAMTSIEKLAQTLRAKARNTPNAVEKSAATMPELQAAARRIPGILRMTPDNKALPKPTLKSIRFHGFTPMGGMYIPTPKQSGQPMPKGFEGAGGKILLAPGGRLGAYQASLRAAMIPSERKLKAMSKMFGVPVEELRPAPETIAQMGANLPKYSPRTLQNSEAFTTLHEAAERRASRLNRNLAPVGGHRDLSVLLNDNNMAAGAEGYGSGIFRREIGKMRRGSGQAQAVQRLLKDTYGIDHRFGAAKLPKAMRNDLLRKMEQRSHEDQRRLFNGVTEDS